MPNANHSRDILFQNKAQGKELMVPLCMKATGIEN